MYPYIQSTYLLVSGELSYLSCTVAQDSPLGTHIPHVVAERHYRSGKIIKTGYLKNFKTFFCIL